MADRNTVTYSRDTLVERLKAQLAEGEARAQESKDRVEARNKAALENVITVLTDHPQLLVSIAAQLGYQFGDKASSSTFVEKVKNELEPPLRADRVSEPYDEFAEIKRLIRVYENAEDSTVEVSVNDSLYRYL